MPVHDAVASRFPLLDGIPSLQAAMADPEMDRRVRAFMEPPVDPAPDVPTRDLTVAGPHGPVPVQGLRGCRVRRRRGPRSSGCTVAPS